MQIFFLKTSGLLRLYGYSWQPLPDRFFAAVGKALRGAAVLWLFGVVFRLCCRVKLMGGATGVGGRRRVLRVVDLVEHQLTGDGRLGAVYRGGAALERRHHLLHHLVEEDVGELGVEEGAELEGDLDRGQASG